MSAGRRSSVLLLLFSLVLLLAAAGTIGGYILRGRGERMIGEAIRNTAQFSTPHVRVHVAPLRGIVRIRPFEWTHPERTLTIKAESLTLRAGPWETAAALAGLRPLLFSRLQGTLERAIIGTSPGGADPLYVTEATLDLRGAFAPQRAGGQQIDLAGITSNSVHGTITLPRGLGLIVLDPALLAPAPSMRVELATDGADGTYHVRADLDSLQYVVGPGLRQELDSRRQGISGTVPPEGIPLERLTLEAYREDTTVTLTGLEAEGPALHLTARGSALLPEGLRMESLSGHLTLHRVDAPLRAPLVPLIYTATGGSLPPRQGPFTLRFTPDHDQPAPQGWRTRVTLE
ncbi:MAG: hypothetical protein EA427_09730 [Spirochaetaceae bacterium]|nr:MAG: hypothetical protein EA427_09730 [Spirochaetaceae bacterium]